MDSRLYWIWLQRAIGCGSPLAGPLLGRFDSPEAVFEADSAALLAAGLGEADCRRLSDRNMQPAKQVLRQMHALGDWMLTPADAAYPALLRGIYAPPLILYGRGDPPDFERQPVVALVGTRRATGYGRRMAASLAAGLTAGGALLLSGGAVGIDEAALSASLAAGGRPVTIQACGLDIDYPKENRPLREAILAAGGAVLSEYPYGVPALSSNFRVRNRLISGLSHGVCVAEAPERSGALITATWAREQGRDVFAVPGEVTSGTSGGANRLIQKGARLVRNAAEMLEEYHPLFPTILDLDAAAAAEKQAARPVRPPVRQPKRTPSEMAASAVPVSCPDDLSEEAKRLFAVLNDTPQHTELLAAAAGLTIAETLAALTDLELAGCVRQQPGQLYIRAADIRS